MLALNIEAVVEAQVASIVKQYLTEHPEVIAAKVGGTAEPVEAHRGVLPENEQDPASRKQRKYLLVLSGTYPCDSTGFPGLTKKQAAAAITKLQAGKRFKVGRKYLTPNKA